MPSRTFTITGIVLKRVNTGETDRIVTLLTQEFGKIACVAKGVRNLHSSRRASLEPGNFVKALCVNTSSMPILTQASLISDSGDCRESLKKVRQLHQYLEIMDRLFVEEEIDQEFFMQVLNTRELIVANNTSLDEIRESFEKILINLGYHHSTAPIDSILNKVAELTERPVRSFEYLVVKPH